MKFILSKMNTKVIVSDNLSGYAALVLYRLSNENESADIIICKHLYWKNVKQIAEEEKWKVVIINHSLQPGVIKYFHIHKTPFLLMSNAVDGNSIKCSGVKQYYDYLKCENKIADSKELNEYINAVDSYVCKRCGSDCINDGVAENRTFYSFKDKMEYVSSIIKRVSNFNASLPKLETINKPKELKISMIHKGNMLLTDNDLDGTGPIILSKIANIKYDCIEQSSAGAINTVATVSKVTEYKNIIVVDLSFNEKRLKQVLESGCNVEIYDHHESSSFIKQYGNRFISDSSRCGTKIYFDEIISRRMRRGSINNATKRFVKLVDVYDRWLDKDSLWEEANKLNTIFLHYRKNGWINEFVNKIVDQLQNNLLNFDDDEFTIAYKTMYYQIADACGEANDDIRLYTDKNGYKYGVTFIEGFPSEVGNYLIKLHELDYVILIFERNPKQVSLRSAGVVDITQFQYIKGHKYAGGGLLPEGESELIYSGIEMS